MYKKYISLEEIANIYCVDLKTFHEFIYCGFFEAVTKNNKEYIPTENLNKIKRVINLYKTLGVNKIGIEIIFEMREKIFKLNEENNILKDKLKKSEEDFLNKKIKKPQKEGLFIEIDL